MHNRPSSSTDIFDVCFEDYQEKVVAASYETPILVDLWADWCMPCLLVAPKLKALIEEHAGRLKLAKLEVDAGENMRLAGQYKVRGFPTVILFIDGEEQGRFHGAQPLSFLRAFVDEHLGPHHK
ncbi:MAG: thioredoxin fold domain-containing protein [Gammaproteobacteria bacterium]|nr:thioredoxin fold domain-containing protein [Gammaproteobacteria bacterium]NNJ98596.1 thioredoxin fold domain-containing protein [Gammaproteobacteria bacterium]